MNDINERIEKAMKRQEERSITLRDLLIAMEPEEPLPDEWSCWDDFRPQSVFKIMLCFMSEEETWIETYRNHVIMIPWYDCKVLGFNAEQNYTMNVWLAHEKFLERYTGQVVEKRIKCAHCKKYDLHNHRCEWWNHGVSNVDWCSYGEERT